MTSFPDWIAPSAKLSHIFRAALLTGFLVGSLSASAEEAAAPSTKQLDTVVISGKRSDEVIQQEVVSALHSDRYFYDGHVTVTVENGVVHLQGVVFDSWDLDRARRIAKKIAGANRVSNELEVSAFVSFE